MYGKIFRQIYNSSIADNWKVRVVFMDLIILSDPDGVVDMTLESISRITNVPLDMVREAIENLQLPDPQSRSIEEEGRRLVKISNDRTWGWRIVNYGRYRNTHTEFDRRSNNHYGDTTKRNYVYYAVSGSQVKIGTSQNPWSRVKEMKTVRPSTHLLAVEDGGHDVEYERHRQFKQYSTDREWFRYEGELKEFVLKLKGVREKDKLRNPDSSANSSEIVVYPSSSPSACSYREGGTGGNNDSKPKRFEKPSLETVKLQAAKIGLPDIEAEKFYAFYESKGWVVGKAQMKSWCGALSGWKLRWQESPHIPPVNGEQTPSLWEKETERLRRETGC